MSFNALLLGWPTAIPDRAIQNIHNYAAHSVARGLHRVLILVAALLYQAFHLNVVIAAFTAILLFVAEVFDARTMGQARKTSTTDIVSAKRTLWRIHAGAVFGACTISFAILSVPFVQRGITDLIPMFLLLAAAAFAVTSMRKMTSVLTIHLVIYSATFVLIQLIDVVQAEHGTRFEPFLNFIISLFVLLFMLDCLAAGLRADRTQNLQLEELRTQNQCTTAALVAKTEFLSTVSHELRTPLTSIRASLDLALAGAFGSMPPKSTQVLTIAQRNALRLGKLIDELLDLQKFEVGMMKFDFCDVQLSELLFNTVTDNRAYARELDVTLSLHPVDTSIFVRADPMRLEQVITNLLSNAAKFSDPESTVILTVVTSQTRVRINVSDQGVGVDPSNRTRIFDSFSQLDNVDIRKVNGTGLGLNISKRIVEAHDGTIDFEPNEGRGTTFFVELSRLHLDDSTGQ